MILFNNIDIEHMTSPICLVPYYFFIVNSGSIAKHLESANTMFSFIWWIIGFYWISAGGEDVIRDAPQLYWYASLN